MAKEKEKNINDENIEQMQNIIGLGKFSARKSYYPELQNRLKELREEKNKFQRIFSDALFGIFQADVNGNVTVANSAMLKILGFSSLEEWQENIKQGNSMFFDSDERRKILSAISFESPILRYETKISRKNGEIGYINFNARKIKDQNGGFIECFVEDITDKKINEQALVESEKRFRKLFNHMGDAIFVTYIEGEEKNKIVEANAEAASQTGFTYLELIGMDIVEDLVVKESRINSETEIDQKLLNGEHYTTVEKKRRKDGSEYWVEVLITPVDYMGRKACLSINRDITERQKIEQERLEYRTKLEQEVEDRTKELAVINKVLEVEIEKQKESEKRIKESLKQEQKVNELKTRFISTVSHEIRTPLTAIKSSSDLLKRYHDRWDIEKKVEHLNRINSSVDYLTNLVENVLTMSRTETGKIINSPENINLKEVIDNLISKSKLIDNGNHYIKHSVSSAHEFIYIDPRLLDLILNNVISNAIKYSPNNTEIILEVMASDILELRITDNGIGIPQKGLDLLFEPFYRAGNADKYKGSGLGLSIVKRTVEMLGGIIEVESKINKGTIFTIKIPLNKN